MRWLLLSFIDMIALYILTSDESELEFPKLSQAIKIPSRAKPNRAKQSQAELEHLNFRAENKLSFFSMYSKALRYAVSRNADLGDTWFLIGFQYTWDTLILAKSLEDTLFFTLAPYNADLKAMNGK